MPVPFLLLQLWVQQSELASQLTPLALQAVQRLNQAVDTSLHPCITAGLSLNTRQNKTCHLFTFTKSCLADELPQLFQCLCVILMNIKYALKASIESACKEGNISFGMFLLVMDGWMDGWFPVLSCRCWIACNLLFFFFLNWLLWGEKGRNGENSVPATGLTLLLHLALHACCVEQPCNTGTLAPAIFRPTTEHVHVPDLASAFQRNKNSALKDVLFRTESSHESCVVHH